MSCSSLICQTKLFCAWRKLARFLFAVIGAHEQRDILAVVDVSVEVCLQLRDQLRGQVSVHFVFAVLHLQQCYKCVTRVVLPAVAMSQMCHAGGVAGTGSVTKVTTRVVR